jgi:hypothetical protein
MRRFVICLALMSFISIAAYGASLTPSEAQSHVGETATVCGSVASAHYAPQSRGQPTFLNLGQAYPNEEFTAVIWGEDRPKFGKPEALTGQRICVTGPLTLYRGKPEMILRAASQLTH